MPGKSRKFHENYKAKIMIYDFHPFETKPDIFRNTGLFSGRGLFETILYEDSVFWFLERHLSRLQKAAEYFQFSRIPEEFYFDRLQSFLKEKQIQRARIKLILLDNESEENPAPYFFQIVPYQRQDSEREIACVTVSHPVSDPIFRQYKTINFGPYFHAMRQIDREKEPIFTENDFLFETPISNIFACKNHQLYTPPLKDGILPGIVRSLLM